jgi:phosphatidylglycerophosphatase GEP4
MHVLRHEEKKPGGLRDVMRYFSTIDDTIKPHELAVVGDRYLTDVAFGNLHGMVTFHCSIITTQGDNWAAKRVRVFEDWLVGKYTKCGVRPPQHPIVDSLASPSSFIH